MSKAGNGGNPPEETQTKLELSATPDETAPREKGNPGSENSEAITGEKPLVVELSNTAEGCWKILAGGERVEISAAEWRRELALQFSKPSTKIPAGE